MHLRRAATSNADASGDAVRGDALAAARSVRITAATRVASRGFLAASNKLDKM